jgi:hypothetical protein
VDTVQKMSTYVCKWKNDTFETTPRIGGDGIKGKGGGGEFKYNTFDTL